MSQGYKTGEAFRAEFTTHNPTTGAATNADALPTGVLVIDGSDNGAGVTVTDKTGTRSGSYSASVTLPTVTEGQTLELVVTSVVGGVTARNTVLRDLATTRRVDELQEVTVQQIVDGVWDELKSAHTTAGSFGEYLDAAITSRSSHAAQAIWDVLESAVVAASSMGLKVKNNLDATVGSRSTFDPATDAVANVTQVATTVSNSDMRGTDGASTHSAADVWTSSPRSLTDKAGFSIAGTLNTLDDLEASLKAVITSGTAAGGSPSTIDFAGGLPTTVPKYSIVVLRAGTGSGQARVVVSSTGGTATIAPDWETTPNTSSVYEVIASPQDLVSVLAIVQNELAALNLRAGAGALVEGAATSATLTPTAFSTNLTETENDQYLGRDVIFLDSAANLAGQKATIQTYNGTTRVITLTTALTQAPSDGDPFVIV